jgi:putative ABC transport system substrate-binding protein
MDRRTFIAATSLIALSPWARAQKGAGVRRIGLLTIADEPSSYWRPILEPLRELGWTEGKTLIVEARYANYDPALLPRLAAELVHLRVELIATQGTQAAIAAKNATATIPIVMLSAGDPVRTGLVASLAHPGGNVTGYSVVSTELRFKRLQLLRELVPNATRVGELISSANPVYAVERHEYEEAYSTLHIKPIFLEVSTASQLEPAIAEVARQHGQALIVPTSDPIFNTNHAQILSVALRYGLPTLVYETDTLAAGGLVSYSPNHEGDERRAAAYIDKILKGARPADLPVEQPTKFVLGINLKVAKALGITVPQALLQRADEIIQ